MNFLSIIEKKKHNIELSENEVLFLVNGFLTNKIKDYQMSSFLMAVYFKGMTTNELYYLTKAMINSGSTYTLEGVEGPLADKHSTGGVGDKTSLIYGPLVAKYGVKVAKISGRGLGKTGGTIDKLESCTGWNSQLSENQFIESVNKVGISIIGQSKNIVPADKILYSLRDVTGTVDSIPLIASSIMSKKLAIRTSSIILDVKVGKGAFMQTIDEAMELANAMVEIGALFKRDVSVILTNMNYPLGSCIGNALEVKEAWNTLNGKGTSDLIELTTLAAAITLLDNKIFENLDIAIKALKNTLKDGSASKFLKDFIENQSGDFNKILNYEKNFTTKYEHKVYAQNSGYLEFNSDNFGFLSMNLGAGREHKDDVIDFSAGIVLNKSHSEYVKNGDLLFTMFTNKDDEQSFREYATKCYYIKDKPNNEKLILKVISKNYNL
ncbi:thymidine phosphorylase [Spiroplasma turonicum]|uniref:Thymidine phosphorylase n=1 Tax=Spiroplasma turonicum TaxID=216946 RepID=A0A0K1P5E5_9MOLU|nr:thymidine phosphorylase [Spiroplasma turonicum]AKU79505.1 thymidine phosphorylase [Spiroplasma turonicum]ALX70527.1 thymidine phosphorylase [Spiroplasma turonicum]